MNPTFQRAGANPTADTPAFSVAQFCEIHSITPAVFALLQLEGRGPEVAVRGARLVITIEAAARWQKSMQEVA